MATVSKDDLIFLVEPAVRKFCGPLFFATSLAIPSGNIVNNASFGLVNTGRKKLLVTCYHVWEEYERLHSIQPELSFGWCLDRSNPISMRKPSDFIVDADKRCDLVTFDMKSLLPICLAGGLEFYDLHANRPPQLNVGDVIFFIGFPGKGRQVDESSVGFVRQPVGVQASLIGESAFYANTRNLKMRAEDFGGISGCPCFRVAKGKPIRLVGFATGFAGMTNGLQFTYARFIGPDGMIRYMS